MLYPSTHCPSRITEGSLKIRECIWRALYAANCFYKGNKTILDIGKSHIYGIPCPFPLKEKGCLAATGSWNMRFPSRRGGWKERVWYSLWPSKPQFSHEAELSQAHNQCLASSRFPVYPCWFQKHYTALTNILGTGREGAPPQLSTADCEQRQHGSICKPICVYFHKHFCWLMSSPPLELTTSTSAFLKLFSKN